MMSRKTVSEISLWPENNDPITTVQSTIEVNRRRRNTLAFDGDAGAEPASGAAGLTCDSLFTISAGVGYRSES